MTVFVEFGSDGEFGFRESPSIAGEKLSTSAEETAVAREGS